MIRDKRKSSVFRVTAAISKPIIKPAVANFVYLFTPYWLMTLLKGIPQATVVMKKISVIQFKMLIFIDSSLEISGKRIITEFVIKLPKN